MYRISETYWLYRNCEMEKECAFCEPEEDVVEEGKAYKFLEE
jgi:hypothetical protein